MRRSQIIKLIISISLLYFAFRTVDLQSLLEVFSHTVIWIIVVGYVFDQLLVVVQTFRWRYILYALQIKPTIRSLIKVNYIGHFFNFFLPTTMGGDVMRYLEISSSTTKKTELLSSIIIERFMGIFSLIFMSLLLSLINISLVEPQFYKYLYFIGFLFLLMCVFVFIPSPAHRDVTVKYIGRIINKLFHVWDSFSIIGNNRKLFIKTFLLSAVVQGGGIGVIYLFSLALGLSIPFSVFMLFTALIILMSLIPVSICGIGVRETGFLFFFSQLGIGSNVILSLSLLTFSRLFILGLVGGGIYTAQNLKKCQKN
ncbi:MAG: lysylphosphatidylglycerol synthase transmembrane domain-containing protein [bacterium]